MEEVDTFYITMNFSIPCPNNSACVPKMDTLKRMNENTLMTAVLVVFWPDMRKNILGDVKGEAKWLRDTMIIVCDVTMSWANC